jgi:hypothetical protein
MLKSVAVIGLFILYFELNLALLETCQVQYPYVRKRKAFQYFRLQSDSYDRLSDIKSLSIVDGIKTLAKQFEVGGVSYKFPNTHIIRGRPTVGKFIIANPKAFLDNPTTIKPYCNVPLTEDMDLRGFVLSLPVIYIADNHDELGTLGYIINRKAPYTLR